jgi:hypothetical protein
MSTKHTPGPWAVTNGHYPSFKQIRGPSFKISVVMWATDLTEDDYRKRDADMHLIAAAPDLLEALEMVRDADDDCKRDGLKTIPSMARIRIDRAIAKATGQ